MLKKYDSDHQGNYTYFIGEEVDSFESVPDDLETLVIPAQKYIKFTNGPSSMPDVVQKPWQQIWQMSPAELGGIPSISPTSKSMMKERGIIDTLFWIFISAFSREKGLHFKPIDIRRLA